MTPQTSWPVIELRHESDHMSHIWRWLDGEWHQITDEPISTAEAQGKAAYMRLRAEIVWMELNK